MFPRKAFPPSITYMQIILNAFIQQLRFLSWGGLSSTLISFSFSHLLLWNKTKKCSFLFLSPSSLQVIVWLPSEKHDQKETARDSREKRFYPHKPSLRWKIRMSCHDDILPCVTMINIPNFFPIREVNATSQWNLTNLAQYGHWVL